MRKNLTRVGWILLWSLFPVYAADPLPPDKWAALCMKSNVLKWMEISHALSEAIKGLSIEQREDYIEEAFAYFHKAKPHYTNEVFKRSLRGLEYALKDALPIKTYRDVKSKLGLYHTFKGYWGNDGDLIQGNIDTEILALYQRLETKRFPAGEITKPFFQLCKSAFPLLNSAGPSAGTR